MRLKRNHLLALNFGQDFDKIEAVGEGMSKEKLIEKIKDLLKTDIDLDFLLELKMEEIERLVACIRDRIDQAGR